MSWLYVTQENRDAQLLMDRKQRVRKEAGKKRINKAGEKKTDR